MEEEVRREEFLRAPPTILKISTRKGDHREETEWRKAEIPLEKN